MHKRSTLTLVRGAVIAALYTLLTLLVNMLGLSSGAIQLRLSEALTILPVLMPEAIPGLFVGCLLSNTLTGCAVWDIVFGSIATLLGALGTRMLRKNKYLAVLPPILANTLIIPFVLSFVYRFEGSLWYFMVTVFIGEVLSCGVLGLFLLKMMQGHKIK